jgi:proteasome lid subunit RPN8/RPN11
MVSPAVKWEAPSCPFQIEFAAGKLEEVRLAVTDQFYALPRGGLEIGGVLFGSREDNLLRIEDYRMIECEHLTGPSFILSRNDREGLERLLAETAKEGLTPLGWFHSHTRTGIFLSAQDLEIHQRFFPEPWQIALVLRPANLEPTRAGYFFRAASGEIASESCVREFVVDPPPEGDFEKPSLHSVREKVPVNGAHRPTVAKKVEAATPAPRVAPPAPQAPPPPPEIKAAAEEPPPLPSFAPPPEPAPQRSGLVWIAAAFAVLSLSVAGFMTRDQWMPKGSPPLKLEASEVDGKLLLRWDTNAPAMRDAASATLEIRDGSKQSSIPLDPVRLGRGFYLYARESENTFVRLAVSRTGAGPVETTAAFSGPLAPHVPTPEEIEAQRRATEAKKLQDKMKTDLDNQTNRNRALQRAVRDLRDQIEQQKP